MSNQLTRFNRVRYTLYSDVLDPLVIKEPHGWNDDEKTLLRDDKYFGVMSSFTGNNLEFYKDAYDYIKGNYDLRGIKGNVRIEREERNSQLDNWGLSYTAYLDFTTYKADKDYVKIKLDESQFFKNIESRIKEKYELERLTDLKGNTLPALTYKDLALEGREIFRQSKFTMPKPYFIRTQSSDSYTVPFDLIYESDDNAFAPAISVANSGDFTNATALCVPAVISPTGSTLVYKANQFFYLTSEEPITYSITVSFKYKMKQTTRLSESLERNKKIYIEKCYKWSTNPLTVYPYAVNFSEELLNVEITEAAIFYTGTVNHTFQVTLDPEESLVMSIRNLQYPSGTGFFFCEITDFALTMDTVQESVVTNCKAVRYFDAIDRILQIITGKQCFQSNLLNNDWRDLLLTNGFKIRNFTDKNITTSLDELIEGLQAKDDIALIIQNGTVRIEKKAEVFLNAVSVDLGVVSNINRQILEKLHWSSIEIGSDFDGKYEEVNGLDEPNIRSTYSTCVDVTDNVFKAISKIRDDSYGITLAQIKQFIKNPKLDTAYDKVNFFLDAKLISGNNYELRHWQDDYPQAPTGIFSPDTAFNLRLSPFSSLKRKSKTISCGLQKFPTERLKYASTEGNSQLVLFVYDNAMAIVQQPERADIQNSFLLAPYFLPEEVTFEKKITLQQFKVISDLPYNLIKFINEYGKIEYAFIYPSVKPNKEGKFQLIKANY